MPTATATATTRGKVGLLEMLAFVNAMIIATWRSMTGLRCGPNACPHAYRGLSTDVIMPKSSMYSTSMWSSCPHARILTLGTFFILQTPLQRGWLLTSHQLQRGIRTALSHESSHRQWWTSRTAVCSFVAFPEILRHVLCAETNHSKFTYEGHHHSKRWAPKKKDPWISDICIRFVIVTQNDITQWLKYGNIIITTTNWSTNQVSSCSFLDSFRNVSCVSADGGRSTAGVQPAESTNQSSKQLFFAW